MECYNYTIGKKDLFAIQYCVEEVRSPYILGRICYWIDGKMVGDISRITILSDALLFLHRIIYDNGNRVHNLFYKMDKDKAFYFLSGQAIVDDQKYEELALKETWARFSIEVGLDVFSGTIVRLIENKSEGRIIFSTDGKNVNEFFLKKGIVDDVFKTFAERLNNYYDDAN